MNEWNESNYNIHKTFAPNCFLYLIVPKNSIFHSSAKTKICTFSKAPPSVWPHTHTKQVTTLRMDCSGTTSIPLYRPKHNADLKTAIWLCWFSRKIWHTKPTKTEPSFRKLNSFSSKAGMLFPAHLQVWELCPLTYSLSLSLEWSQATHILTSIKTNGAYKPKK